MRTLLHNRAIDHPPPVRIWLKGAAAGAAGAAAGVAVEEAADMEAPVRVGPAGHAFVLTAVLLYLTRQVFHAI